MFVVYKRWINVKNKMKIESIMLIIIFEFMFVLGFLMIKNSIYSVADLSFGFIAMIILSAGIYFGLKIGMISGILASIACGLYMAGRMSDPDGAFSMMNYFWIVIFPSFGYTGSLFSNYMKRLNSDVEYLKQNLDGYMNADIITNYKNAQWFFQELAGDMAKAQRHDIQFSVIVIEIKNLMEFAKYYGYFRTEDLLARVANKTNELTRNSDKKYAIEKDKFALILPGTDSYGAQVLKVRLNENLKLIEGELNIKGRTSVIDFNLGYMEYEEGIDTPQKFLYKIKKEMESDYLESHPA